ncbi:TetR family transcriptional regulator [Mycobacterium sp. CBMA293]|uniref:TetR/AcrR family transcriptional regulator n=1 Tax=unclassified Mycolicibacterium TaxID=2636767 RepID=UPI0012DFD34C|nr:MULTISPECIES: TetR family transcriptional regulator [unclassified Mycolicibacterium]MUL47224.1 TetR family transcriptional regulator [Mycolicibacterium sp. CBMA 360]MUL61334.1 TetR family transcriptional regulator [Mycolicibacterium sp. CBMA 335]MUL72069.1 TetR family transcriptional regulator [Mycolicibacterium sp. CBMA 311]MUL96236.1 TetR family transcriptional regulator [Mycolicibacterium sp. CBMA 230]MUM08940.1 hypothetical protein [Mycolicibacterium sp. CBMA 213]
MPRVSDSRARMVRAAAVLFQKQGYAATGWRQVIAKSKAPWGSQAHHFPGGKEQLATDALALSAAQYENLLRQAMPAHNPADAIRMWAAAGAEQLKRSGWTDGCPVATVALESSGQSETLATACHAAFSSWHAVLTESLIAAGMGEGAESLALTVLAGIEGGLLLARAAHDETLLRDVGDQLAELIREKLPQP